MRGARSVVRSTLGAGVGLAAYAFVEPYLFRLQRHRLTTREETPPVSVLHVSDTHMHGRHRRMARWLEGLGDRLEEAPDLVIATGDLISDGSGIAPVVDALAALPARVGRYYVLGSHDYYQASFQNYLKYFTDRRAQTKAAPAATAELEAGLKSAGFQSLTNSTEYATLPGGEVVRLAGVDDPHLDRHDTSHLRRGAEDALAIAVVHAPYVVSECVLAGFDLILAGHTHGGQVRFPFLGAVVTNSTLPAALAAGPHRVGGSWLHVSPGMGASRYAPIRFNCPPEVTILELGPAVL